MDPYQWEEVVCTHKYASKSINSRGRERSLKDDKLRSAFQRDTHRIIYSWPFRRLKHKTQVFYSPKNDHICTRLEHAHLVASASMTIARALGLNEDLCEAIGLGHDLGHAPFGHHGEKILANICKNYNIQETFHHEVNSLRTVDRLAQMDRDPEPGLALTFEVRDGIVSHCGEDLNTGQVKMQKGEKKLDNIKTRQEAGFPCTLEGCIVRLVDRVAYAGRDLEDGLCAELITEKDIPQDIVKSLGKNNGRIMGTLIRDIIEHTPKDSDYICISSEKCDVLKRLIEFNYKNIYYHDDVQKYKKQAELSLNTLFDVFHDFIKKSQRFTDKNVMRKFENVKVYNVFNGFFSDLNYTQSDSDEKIVLDFLSGFTDNYVKQTIQDLYYF
ncbi:MAG: deoxyguanosinetriphosphate triphosphohydrolase [Candidatus Zixiibacteriota bacterium]|nr:MAG: deoxyguanosinetriphosphate triphosphohydrolase [candidate division Zixibacteria bacterium]